MRHYLFTRNGSPLVHGSPTPIPFMFYCSGSTINLLANNNVEPSEGPVITCPTCRAELESIWRYEIERLQPGDTITVTDHKGRTDLSNIRIVNDTFAKFTATREGQNPTDCHYKLARLINILIDGNGDTHDAPA